MNEFVGVIPENLVVDWTEGPHFLRWITKEVEEMTEEEMRQAVKKGAELLDREKPGWRPRIDKRRLNLRWVTDCILGQLYGNYRIGISILRIEDCPEYYGFVTSWKKWDLLKALWLEELADVVEQVEKFLEGQRQRQGDWSRYDEDELVMAILKMRVCGLIANTVDCFWNGEARVVKTMIRRVHRVIEMTEP